MTDTKCDCCQRPGLKPLYKAPDTQRGPDGLTVHGCPSCGLVQSLPRIDKAARNPMAVSAGANWGNVRYGKAFRTPDNIDLLTAHTDPANLETILDVGANRGAFCAAIKPLAPKALITALEPDERVIDDYQNKDRIRLVQARIEETSFEDAAFDLIYSCHTLEHLKSPHATLTDHWRTLKTGGYLLLELPNLHILGVDDMVEEFFIDKHLYHYTPSLMVNQLEALGFDIIVWPDLKDTLNITILAQKTPAKGASLAMDASAFDQARDLVAIYSDTLKKNQAALTTVAREIEALATSHRSQPLAIWGAGRLFNSLVEHGNLDVGLIAAVADKHLAGLAGQVKGARLITPADLPQIAPKTIVIMSRAFFDEISCEAKLLTPDATLISYTDLIHSAHDNTAIAG